jgi:hypothetical protein
MPPLYLGRYTHRSRFRTEDSSPKVRIYLLAPADPRFECFLSFAHPLSRSNCAVQMARFTGKSPSTDKAFAFGSRVTVNAGDVFPDEATVGVAPFRDLDGRPLYVGTAILDDSAVPCQVRPPSACLSTLLTSEIPDKP